MYIGDHDFYRDLLYQNTGMLLGSEKSFLLDSRLTPIARQWNYTNVKAMTLALHAMPNPALLEQLVEAMLPGETEFFRDSALFDLFEDRIFPALMKGRGRGALRIWCAGCATGQEPYSLAMLLKQMQYAQKLRGWRADILATDINHAALEKAQAGLYSRFDIQQGLPASCLTQFFLKRDDQWQVTRDVASLISFEQFNLLDDMSAFEPFDLILCRNVLSTLDERAASRILDAMTGCLKPGGMLALGLSETVPAHIKTLKPMAGGPSLYARLDGPAALA